MSFFSGYTSRDAYNGCLSLYSEEERIQRGYSDVLILLINTNNSNSNNNNNNNNNKNNKNKLTRKEIMQLLHQNKNSNNNNNNNNNNNSNNEITVLNKLNYETLDDIIENTINNNSDEIINDTNFMFYTLQNENLKIQILNDTRSFDYLVQSFKNLPVDFITVVWAAQDTWGACYDILSTFQTKDHNSFTFNYNFDPIAWPTLQSAYPKYHKKMIKNSPINNKNNQINNKVDHVSDHSDNENHSHSNGSMNSNVIIINVQMNDDNDDDDDMNEFDQRSFNKEDKMSDNGDVISLSSSNLSGFSWCVTKKENDDFEEIESIHSEASWEVLSDDYGSHENNNNNNAHNNNNNNANNNNVHINELSADINVSIGLEFEERKDNDDNDENEHDEHDGDGDDERESGESEDNRPPISLPILSIPIKTYKDALLFEPPISTTTTISTNSKTKSFSSTKSYESQQFYEITPLVPNYQKQHLYHYDAEEYEDYIGEVDTYLDWLESTHGSKVTSAASTNRIRLTNVKKSHEQKKKTTAGCYSKKYVK